VGLVEHNHMIEAFPPDGADDALGIRILPRRTRAGDRPLDSHAFDAVAKTYAVSAVAITDQIGGRLAKGGPLWRAS